MPRKINSVLEDDISITELSYAIDNDGRTEQFKKPVASYDDDESPPERRRL